MNLKKTLGIAALTAALALTACSPATSTPADAGSVTTSAKPAASAEAKTTALEFNSSEMLGGNAKPIFPEGESGKVSVVAQGELKKNEGMSDGMLLFAYRNNTNAAISHVDFTVAASADGKIVGSGNSQSGGIPAQVQPGEVALDYIYFSNVASIPDGGVTYDFKVKTLPADTSSFNTAALKVTQADNNGTGIIGAATNATGKTLSGPFGVYAYCFDGNNLLSLVQSYATETDELAAGAQATFSIDLYGRTCDSFVLGVSGYFG